MKRRLLLVLLIGFCLNAVGSGEMIRQIWDGTATETLDAVRDFHADKRPGMTLDPPPDYEDILEESWFGSRADNYWANLWGWVTIPVSGTYTWHLHGDNNSILYISTDESMDNVEEVAYVDGWSDVGQWDKFATQTSEPFTYSAGQTLAVWAIMVEGSGGDDLGIGWTMPGSNTIEYISDHVSIVEPTPTKAKNPSPELDAVDVPRDTDLSWSPGKFAVSHDVYLGTSFDDVNDASRANPMDVLISEGQAAETYDPGILEFGQTYYWRVDEVNAVATTIFKGPVWAFTVEPFAYPIEGVLATTDALSAEGEGIENVVNGSGLNAAGEHSINAPDMWLGAPSGTDPIQIEFEFSQVHKMHEALVWNYNVQFEPMLGFGVKNATFEYSADGVDWTVLGDVEFAQATAKADYAANTAVDFGGVAARYVRLTIHSGYGPLGKFGLSEIQFMQIPAHARQPEPADGQTDVLVGTTLAWRAGREAVSHEVYLSTDPTAVAEGSTLAGTTETPSFMPAGLEFGLDYYWKVIEVNEADAITAWESAVWTFQTQEYALIDDMESYDDDQNRIYETWLDGWVNETGSTVGYLDAPFAERSIVNSGAQSMPLQYDNSLSPLYSEAQKDLGGMNLSSNGADTLRLFVSGLAPEFFEATDGTILMNGIGTDIEGSRDEFRYVYKNLLGDGSIVARVDDLDESPNSWAKAGVMIRQSEAVGSQHAMTVMTGGDGGGAAFQRRIDDNGTTTSNHDLPEGPFATPYWVRIDRAGNAFSSFLSADGQTWIQAGDALTIEMDDAVLIGLALTSHNVSVATSAQFSNVSITGNVSGDWQIAEIGAEQPEGNTPASVYVAVEDNSGKVAVVTHPDTVLSARSGWTEWIIPYTDLTGINLSNVSTIYVGVGDRNNPSAGGSGTIFVDDIGFGRPVSVE